MHKRILDEDTELEELSSLPEERPLSKGELRETAALLDDLIGSGIFTLLAGAPAL
jgi:hypothetical protein